MVGDGLPVVHRGTAERVGTDLHARVLDGLHVDDVLQVLDVEAQELVALALRPGLMERDAGDPLEVAADVGVGAVGDPARGVGVGRAAVRRVVLEAAVGGRVVARGDDDAVGEAGVRGEVVDAADLALVGPQDRVAHRGGGGVAVLRVDEDAHVVGDEHLDRARPRRLGEPVGVAPEEQRPVEALLTAVVDDRLGRGEDVVLVEGRLQARPAMSRGAEDDLLVDVLRVGPERVVRGDEVGDVDEVAGLCGLSCAGVGHGPIFAVSEEVGVAKGGSTWSVGAG